MKTETEETIGGPKTSPARRPPAPEMDYGDALRDVLRGLKITRKEWGNSKDYLLLHGGVLHIHIDADRPDLQIKAGLHKFITSEGDLMATDWIVTRD